MKGLMVGIFVVLGLVVVVGAVGLAFVTRNSQSPQQVVESTTPEATQSAEIEPTLPKDPILEELGLLEGEVTLVDPSSPETVDLVAVNGATGSGTASREFNGETFIHAVAAQIGAPAAGKFYEGWLVKKQPEVTFMSTGKLEKIGDNYLLVFTAQEDKSDYADVVVTLETEANGLDGQPELHILEGSF